MGGGLGALDAAEGVAPLASATLGLPVALLLPAGPLVAWEEAVSWLGLAGVVEPLPGDRERGRAVGASEVPASSAAGLLTPDSGSL